MIGNRVPGFALTGLILLSLAPSRLPASEAEPEAQDAAISNSVVKIFSTLRSPNISEPWTKGAPTDATGTGVVIEGKRILTNAHMVTYASQVFVRPQGSSDRLTATVAAVAPYMDLALLKLEDESFFDKRPPVPRVEEIPNVKEGVVVYGYPTGGDSLSVTKGIVSRMEFTAYVYSRYGLRIQVDAAINPGNSGGPALVNNKMIGLVFSRLNSADNIGYIIPSEEIDLFLKDVADGHYDGKAAMHDELQTLENDAIRRKLKLGKPVAGIVVRRPDRDDPSYPLRAWDVITKVGEHDVDNTGMVQVHGNLRLYFGYFVQKLAKDGKVRLTVVRDGKPLDVDLPVGPKRDELVPHLAGRYPSYFIYGPLSFTTVTSEFLTGLDAAATQWLPYMTYHHSPLVTRRFDRTRFEGEELVMIAAPMFPHRLAKGYSNAYFQVIKDVNGIPVKNLRHLVEILRDMNEPFVTIRFHDREVEDLVFDHKQMLASTEEILTDNGIRQQASDDLLPVWSRKK